MRLPTRRGRTAPIEPETPPGEVSAQEPSRLRQSGQVLALFVLSMVVLTGMVAVVVDISWFWSNSLRVQRAADAAALAGAIYLPGSPGTAYSVARAEATKNGYTGGSGTTITPTQDPTNPRRLNVRISTPVKTFFAQIFGMSQITVTETARAEYTLAGADGQPAVLPRDPQPHLQEQPGPMANR